MKRCPKCSRTYPDENQKFCTIDGGLLMTEQPAFDPNLTIRATADELGPPSGPSSEFSEAPTSMRLPVMDETITAIGTSTYRETATAPSGPSGVQTSSDLVAPDQSAPTSADLGPLPQSAPTSADLKLPAETTILAARPVSTELPAAPPAAPPPPKAPPPTSQPLPAPPVVAAAAPAKKKSMLPLIIGVVVILLLLVGGGAVAAGYFFWLKPRMEANQRPAVTLAENENSNENTNTSTNTNANSDTANTNNSNANTSELPTKEPEPFVPTAGALQFGNSKEKLDGKLLEHYLDFSFYYPQGWQKDPTAGVPGASNFVRLSDSTDQYAGEQVAMGWYTSNGTFELDSPIFHDRAKALSDQFAKSLPGYQELSQGNTSVNTLNGYEFRFKGVFKNTPTGDLPYWGRVIFLPPGSSSEKNGVTIIMLATSRAAEVTGADDVGVKGKLPLVLESFRFGASR